MRVSNPWCRALSGEEAFHAGGGERKEVLSDCLLLSCTLIRSSRKTWSVQVKADGEVILRIPHRMSDAEAMETAGRHSQWIAGHYRRAVERCKERREYNKEEIEDYKKRLRPVLEERISYFAGRMKVDYNRITIRAQKTRWGSCSAKGNLNFNWKLMLAPGEILDYVVVHELAHRIEMNHSPRFWQQVAQILPDYKARRNWLKENGGRL